MIVADLQRRVHADHVDGVGEAGVVGRLAGSSERAPVPSTSAKNGCCGPPSLRAAAELGHLEPHRALRRDAARRAATHARGDRAREQQPAEQRGDHEQRERPAAAANGRWRHFAAPVVAAAAGRGRGGEAGAVARRPTTLYAVIFQAPAASGWSTKSARADDVQRARPSPAVAPVDVDDRARR